ncbi:MAG: hypothetical protein WKG07_20530 [Hymenobacter sp.]
MVGLPARPGGAVSQHFPHAQANGLLAFYRRVFATGEAGEFGFPYQTEAQDSFFLVAARRSGEVLIASIIDGSQHPEHPALAQALRASQAREQAAREGRRSASATCCKPCCPRLRWPFACIRAPMPS